MGAVEIVAGSRSGSRPPGYRPLVRPLHSPARWVAVPAIAVAAAAHVPVTPEHLEEAPYMGVLFIVLTVACAAIGVALLVWDAPVVYGLAVLTCGLAVIGYAATRLVAFPMLGDDVGNWFEPLGVVSVLTEALVVAAAATALARRSR
ncbi:MAG: hypothetical protein ACTHNT_03375 [Actinomycetales bacterium]